MAKKSRLHILAEQFPDAPNYRNKQFMQSLFESEWNAWMDVSVFPNDMRNVLEAEVPFWSVNEHTILSSMSGDTYKALLKLASGLLIETVLMKNRRGQWTICVSSQVGCAMGCTFCATGKMGFKENLLSDEIVDQYRFWKKFLHERSALEQRISNIVFMGMGEPLANYENVRDAVNVLLEYTDLGPTHITVSTVGVIPVLKKLLEDPHWPRVRIAISLHSADPKTRSRIVLSSYEGFLDDLRSWSQKYLTKFGNKKHHLTYEYVLLDGTTDTAHHANVLANYVRSIGNVKINLIPFNFVSNTEFSPPSEANIEKFATILKNADITVMVRKNMGRDIDAACGQLAAKEPTR